MFHHAGLYEGSYKYFDQATSTMRGEIIVKLEPEEIVVEEVEAVLNQCSELRIQDNYEDAVFQCNEVLMLEPNNIEALNNKGIALILLKKYNLAIMTFVKTLELSRIMPMHKLEEVIHFQP